MQNKKFIPAGRTLANAGAGTDLVANCIVLNIDDNMDSIGKTLHEAMLLQQQGSGLGFDFSKLRPVGYKAKRSNGNASGPVSFLEIYDNAFSIIKQQGRHGANMGMLRIDHPDILDFISCKEKEGVITNFNISVLVTDEFMQKLQDNPNQFWMCNFDGKEVYPREIEHKKSMFGREEIIREDDITVGEVWQRLCEGAHRNGEPGIAFVDTVNKNNSLPGLGDISCANPCGEQFLHPYDNCNLGSINVASHYKPGNGGIDYEGLGRTVDLAVRMLDNTIDLFNHSILDVNLTAKKNRRIGLGIMGFADLCFKSRTRYGSERSINLAEQLMGFINGRADYYSIELAKSKGNFPNHHLSIYGNEFAHEDGYTKTPMRNAARTSIAPTGSISMILDVNSGIEPWFNLVYTKKVRAGEFSYISPVFEKALRDNFEGYDMKEILGHLHKGLSLQDVHRDYIEIPEWILDTFVTTSDVKPTEHIDIQATFQKYTNNSISKTINLPNDATVDDIDKAGKYAWTNGCRSVTFYRDGSREHQVLNTGEIKPEDGVEELEHFHGVIDRPSTVHGETHMIQTAHGKMYVTVNMWEYNGETKPYEIFAYVGKEGQCSHTYVSAITRIVSLALRSGVPIEDIVSQYKGISCHTGWHEGRRNEGPIDALSQVLEKFIGKNIAGIINDVGEKIKDDIMPIDIENLPICPSCQAGWLISEEGCWKCMSCNWSKC